MEKEINSEMSNKIIAIAKMYPKKEFKIRVDEKYICLSWLDSQPTQVKASKGRKMQRKLDQVKQILGNNFMEFYWGGDRQMVYSRF